MNQLRQLAQAVVNADEIEHNGDKVFRELAALSKYLRSHPDIDSAERFFEQGEWCATTLGGYVKLLIDQAQGSQDVIFMRVVGENAPDADGNYARKLEVLSVPRSMGLLAIDALNPTTIHQDLQAEIKAGLIT